MEMTFLRGKGRPVVRYSEALRWAVQQRLNRSRCCLGCGLGWAQRSMCYLGCTLVPPVEYDWTVCVWRRCGPLSNYFDDLFNISNRIGNRIGKLLTFQEPASWSPGSSPSWVWFYVIFSAWKFYFDSFHNTGSNSARVPVLFHLRLAFSVDVFRFFIRGTFFLRFKRF